MKSARPSSFAVAPRVVLTVGHSVHLQDAFVGLLTSNGADVVVDVRSSPFSRWRPHFDKDALAFYLPTSGISYLALGEALGGRPSSMTLCGMDGVADYEAMARTPEFDAGLARVLALASERRPVLVCSEGDPLTCHRCLLVGRRLLGRGAKVEHVLPGGGRKTQEDVERDLLREVGPDLFTPETERLADAYRTRASRHAFRKVG